MKLKNILTLTICVLFSVTAFAQSQMRTIKGTVLGASGEPLSGVQVSINEGAHTFATDAEGDFEFGVYTQTFVLFEAKGYKSQVLSERNLAKNGYFVIMEPIDIKGVNEKVSMPYGSNKIEMENITSAMVSINADEAFAKDSRWDASSMFTGSALGLMSDNSIRNYGKVTYVVDGIVRDNIDNLNSQEIENISILKDGVSRLLYGAAGDAGVIVVTTKRGQNNNRSLRFDFQSGVRQAMAFPEFVDAATNMQLYNMAATNVGITEGLFEQDVIEATASGVDNVMYPDVDYYGDMFVKRMTTYNSFFAEASGGNSNTNYYMNLGWDHENGWMNLGDDYTDDLSVKAKVTSKVSNWLSFKSDVALSFNIKNDAYTADSYWDMANTALQFSSPLLIPIDRIADASSYSNSSVIDGKYILGGSSVYPTNIYGERARSANYMTIDRNLVANLGFDFDFNKWVKGLTASVYGGFEYMNFFAQTMNNKYAVYEPTFDADGNITVSRFNEDITTIQRTIVAGDMNFYRRSAGYANVNYQRNFGKHAVSAVMTASMSEKIFNKVYQTDQRFNGGALANYSYDDRYIVELGGAAVGSARLAPGEKLGFAPSVGLGWLASNESFMPDVISHLKIRANYSQLINDNWTLGKANGHLIYDPLYTSKGKYYYNYDGSRVNSGFSFYSGDNDISWQRREEYNLGFDMSLFDHATWVEANVFRSKSYDILTDMTNYVADTMGGLTQYENYNGTTNNGIEVGIRQRFSAGDLKIDLGANYLYTVTRYDQVAEFDYGSYYTDVGTVTHRLEGIDTDGLFVAEDFDEFGELPADSPYRAPYGDVQPGDIRYTKTVASENVDYASTTDLGSNINNHIASVNFNLNYKNWQFYMLWTGGFGGHAFKNSEYYWFEGNNVKYSVEALKSWDPTNPSADAEYPRLTLGTSENNYRPSSFWVYDLSNVRLSAVQVSHKFNLKSSVISSMSCYLRGSNLLVFAKDKDDLLLNYGQDPESRNVVLGLSVSF